MLESVITSSRTTTYTSNMQSVPQQQQQQMNTRPPKPRNSNSSSGNNGNYNQNLPPNSYQQGQFQGYGSIRPHNQSQPPQQPQQFYINPQFGYVPGAQLQMGPNGQPFYVAGLGNIGTMPFPGNFVQTQPMGIPPRMPAQQNMGMQSQQYGGQAGFYQNQQQPQNLNPPNQNQQYSVSPGTANIPGGSFSGSYEAPSALTSNMAHSEYVPPASVPHANVGAAPFMPRTGDSTVIRFQNSPIYYPPPGGISGGSVPQPSAPEPKKEKRILTFVNPNTKEVVKLPDAVPVPKRSTDGGQIVPGPEDNVTDGKSIKPELKIHDLEADKRMALAKQIAEQLAEKGRIIAESKSQKIPPIPGILPGPPPTEDVVPVIVPEQRDTVKILPTSDEPVPDIVVPFNEQKNSSHSSLEVKPTEQKTSDINSNPAGFIIGEQTPPVDHISPGENNENEHVQNDHNDDPEDKDAVTRRLHYTREKLMQINNSSVVASTIPAWLSKSLQIIKKSPTPQQNRPYPDQRPQDGRDNRGGRNQPGQIILDGLISDREPVRPVARTVIIKDQTADEKILFEIRSLLNKLTPQNQEKLTKQLIAVPFDENAERLQGTVDLIFEKALDEPSYAETYAELCQATVAKEVPEIVHADGSVSAPLKFRTVLLQRAQRYFEKTDKEIIEAEAAKPDDETNKNQAEELALKKGKAKRRYFGNIKFISELFKQEMLSERIILSCYSRLLPKKADYSDLDEEKVECLSKLLMTTGKAVSLNPECSQQVELFFKSLKSMIDSGKTSSRLRFLMQDAIDLKDNKFIPRNVKVGPQTVDEVRKQSAIEQQKARDNDRRLKQDARDDRSYGGRDSGRMAPLPQNSRLMEPVGMKKTSSVPAGMSNMPGSARGAGRTPGVDVKSSAAKPPSKFLSSMAKEGNRDQEVTLGLPTKPAWGAGSGSLNRQSVTPRASMDNKSAASSRDSSRTRVESSLANRRSSTQTPILQNESALSKSTTPSATPVISRSPVNGELSPEALARSLKQIESIVSTNEEADVTELVTNCVNATRRMSDDQKKEVITDVLNKIIEGKTEARQKLGYMVAELSKHGCFSPDVFMNSLGEIVSSTEDIAVDQPMMHVYFIECVAPLVIESDQTSLTLDIFEQILRRTVPDHTSQYQEAFKNWLKSHPDLLPPEKKESLIGREAEWSSYLNPS